MEVLTCQLVPVQAVHDGSRGGPFSKQLADEPDKGQCQKRGSSEARPGKLKHWLPAANLTALLEARVVDEPDGEASCSHS